MRSVMKFRGGELHPNTKLGGEIRSSGVLADELERRAQLAALGAKEIALRVAFDKGDYFASIHAGVAVRSDGVTVGRVSADDFKAHWIENPHRLVARDGRVVRVVPGRNVLRRGARRAGLKVRAAKHTRPE